MAKYTPNCGDPRVQRKIRSALAWATQMLDENTSKSWSSRHLDQKIGYLHTDLGRYLRHSLLKETNPHYSSELGYTKQYTLRLEGVQSLAQQIGLKPPLRRLRVTTGLALACTQWSSVLEPGVFEYEEKSHRLWHELQNVSTSIRTPLFAHYGYNFNYDIENCYPTLVLQCAQATGRLRKPLTQLAQYVENPQEYRRNLAHTMGTDIRTAKRVILAKFNGGSLRNQGSIAAMLSRVQLHKLKHSTQFQNLCKDLDRCWGAVARDAGQTRFSARRRMQFYLTEEHRVMTVIRSAFSKKNISIFLEHDGWRSRDYIDPHTLKLQVRKHTGYDVMFSCEVVSRVSLHETTSSLRDSLISSN